MVFKIGRFFGIVCIDKMLKRERVMGKEVGRELGGGGGEGWKR